MYGRKPRAVVAMSGGVDSSVAAALLLEQGYEVIGMMMRLWSEESKPGSTHNRCCTPEQMSDARRIADKLGIPFYVLDTKDVFRNTVVAHFIEQHRRFVTPNPCIECNRQIRFNFLFENAMALGADYLATGHYAQIDRGEPTKPRLRMARDQRKDQSYVLCVLQQRHLMHTKFPVGQYTKDEVRQIAAQFSLPTASKQESQDLCFLGDGDYRRFLQDYAPDVMKAGPIVLTNGTVIGEHKGLANYTIGQRKGLGVSSEHPLYVIATNPYRNALIVGTKDQLGTDTLIANRMNWVSGSPPSRTFRANVKIRYKGELTSALIKPISPDQIYVRFDEPVRDITPGQGAVIYDNDVVLGGGIIIRKQETEDRLQESDREER